ncbi:RNA 3'-terminal phosphate cyclase-domain-containing protein [Podospora didyma]|uniref:RNA 3'-terminal phosphate cyclase-domain-containing protein n=1 Tax=Podospora didyma TaxID=330526 RepID=A0AAE0K9B6_9PEZI|nr:RNA 3'-terminal phosphate cyclase-domain-containing protein [Podospora didyma]
MGASQPSCLAVLHSPLIEIDGRTGEGGGQLVRIACALAAVMTVPIRITNVRGNRGDGPRGGGLKSQHVSSIQWLAKATDADVDGLSVGSHTLEFRPRLKPSQLKKRRIRISADSAAASTLLIFQAVFPFLLFAGTTGDRNAAYAADPIELEISGGTNVSFSLSFEYLDQVLLPTLEDAFVGIRVERQLKARGWSQGKASRGTISFKIHPLRLGETLKPRNETPSFLAEDFEVTEVDVNMIVPSDMHEELPKSLAVDLEDLFPGVEVTFKLIEDSGADSRVYVLLVARSKTLRWGRDILASTPKTSSLKTAKKARDKTAGASDVSKTAFSADVSRQITKDLYEEVSTGGVVDRYLHDQLVVFQALAEGSTSFPRCNDNDEYDGGLDGAMEALDISEESLHEDRMSAPFGEGSLHTTTARWVTAELLPEVAWFNKGRVCQGIGMHMDKTK